MPALPSVPDIAGFPLPPRFVVRAVLAARRRLRRLIDAMVPPSVALTERVMGHFSTHAIGAVVRLGIPDLLAHGPSTAAELAKKTGVDGDALHRLLRALASQDVFTLDAETGRFANNRLSSALREDHPDGARAFAAYAASRSHLGAWMELDHSLATGRSAFEHANRASIWDWFTAHPEEEKNFTETMTSLTRYVAPALAAAYPFGEIRRLCDVAGGRGTLLATLLQRQPHLRGLLFDGPGPATLAPAWFAAHGVGDRAEVATGNFFEAIPGGCDAYLLKDVLHDWDDERSIRILENVRRASLPGTRLLVCEMLVDEMSTDDPGPLVDVQMLIVCDGGRQRSRADFARLFARAGFTLRRVIDTPLPISIVEGVAV